MAFANTLAYHNMATMTMKRFIVQVSRVFVAVSHFYPSVIFAGKAMCLLLEWNPVSVPL
jgi:hypothetical protein